MNAEEMRAELVRWVAEQRRPLTAKGIFDLWPVARAAGMRRAAFRADLRMLVKRQRLLRSEQTIRNKDGSVRVRFHVYTAAAPRERR